MAATATARKPATATRRAASRRPAAMAASGSRAARPAASPTLRRARSTTTWLVPAAAVGRTAVAVGDLADSGVVFRLTRGRLWIGLLATLLVGIVGLNVMALSFSASSSKTGRAADELERQNSALRAQLASQLTNEELQRTASRLGLIVPEPGAYGYLEPGPDDAGVAAKRLRSGELTFTDAAPAAAAPETTEPQPVTEPVAAATGDPAAEAAATAPATDAATEAPAPVGEPVATTPPSAPAGGVPAP